MATSTKHNHSTGKGYTWFVRMAKILLPAAALVIIAVVITQLSEDPLQSVQNNIPENEKTTPGQIELVEAQYEGVDEKGRAYSLIAEKAIRMPGDPDTVLLEKLKADITMQDKSWIAVHAAKGIYKTKEKSLSLAGDISLFHDSGYEVHLDTMHINIETRQAASTDPVHVQGPMGKIDAKTIKIADNGAIVTFGGPATLTLYENKE